MRAYLAGRYGRRAELARVAGELRKLGIGVTSRWLDGDHDQVDDAIAALEDLADIRAADVVISWTEGDAVPGRARGGRHVEFGLAYALGKRLIVVGHRENVFHSLPRVELLEDERALLALLRRERLKTHAGEHQVFSTESFIDDKLCGRDRGYEHVRIIGSATCIYCGAHAPDAHPVFRGPRLPNRGAL